MLIDIPANIFDPEKREQTLRDAAAILNLPDELVDVLVPVLVDGMGAMGVLHEPEQMVDYLNALERLAILGGVAGAMGTIGANQLPAMTARLEAIEARLDALEA